MRSLLNLKFRKQYLALFVGTKNRLRYTGKKSGMSMNQDVGKSASVLQRELTMLLADYGSGAAPIAL